MTEKKKWTKRGINGDLIIYSNVDNMNELKVRFELFSIQIWWKVNNPKLKKKGSKTRVITFKRLSTKEETKETIALRFANAQICNSFIAKWESLTRDIEYVSSDNAQCNESNNTKQKAAVQAKGGDDDDDYKQMDDEDKAIESFVKVADKSSFRDLIRINRMPSMDLINSSQILNGYHFDYETVDTIEVKHNSINYANFSYGKYKNDEHYLSIWMNAAFLQKLKEFNRPRVNMVIALDQSESMKESLTINERSRMEIAQEALVQLIRHTLDKQDKFGIISFNERAKIIHGMTLIDSLNYGMLNVRRDILNIKAFGGTNLTNAYKKALSLFTENVLKRNKKEGVYNRIVFMTDYQFDATQSAMYNDKDGIFGMMKAAAMEKDIYTTVILMGVEIDFELFYKSLSNVRGCNYLCVQNKQDFISKFHKEKEFQYVFFPILYDLEVRLDAKIERVYTENMSLGNVEKGQLLKVNSMFGHFNYSIPLILRFEYAKEVKLSIGYSDKNGKRSESEQIIDFTFADEDDFSEDNKAKMVKKDDFCESIGIRKVVLVCRYIDLLKEWVGKDGKKDMNEDKLFVSDEYREKFAEFAKYFEKEMNALNDKSLQKELNILKKLAVYQDTVDID